MFVGIKKRKFRLLRIATNCKNRFFFTKVIKKLEPKCYDCSVEIRLQWHFFRLVELVCKSNKIMLENNLKKEVELLKINKPKLGRAKQSSKKTFDLAWY